MQSSYTKSQDSVLLILRLMVAAIFLYAGYAKWGFWSATPEGMSAAMLNLTKFLSIAEPLGAIALVVGFLTRLSSALLGVIMIGAIFIMQFTMQIGFSTAQGPGWDFPLMILGGCIVLTAFGAGSFAVDTLLKKA